MKGWIIYKKNSAELTELDHGVLRFLEAGKKHNILIEVFKPDDFDIIVNPEDPNRLICQGKKVELPDFVMPRMGADTSYQALSLIHHLESANVLCVNNAHSIDYVKNKMLAAQILVHHNLPTPKTLLLKFPYSIDSVIAEIGFPLVIKTLAGMRGQGVFLCESESQFHDLMGLLVMHQNQKPLIAQEFVANSYGRDLRVFIVNGRILGCMQRTAVQSFKANFSLGGNVTPYPINQEISTLSLRCAELFGLEIAGIDLLFGEKGFLICEANSSPGFKGMEKTTNLDIAESILQFIVEKIKSRQ